MSGEWIKMRLDLASDPAVIRIRRSLGLDVDAVVGKLHRLWSWADAHTVDGGRQRILERHHEAPQDQCRLEAEPCRERRNGAARHEPDQDRCRQRHDGFGHGQAALQQDHEQEHAAAALRERLEAVVHAQQVDVAV